MSTPKRRLTVTVDPESVEAGNRAVATGRADSLSAWVSSAMSEKAYRDEKLALLGAAIIDYEAEFGEITATELAAQNRADRSDAVVVRGPASRTGGQARRAKRTTSA